jgi:hypothetical protein
MLPPRPRCHALWKHYLTDGRTKQRPFDQVVIDYERARIATAHRALARRRLHARP